MAGGGLGEGGNRGPSAPWKHSRTDHTTLVFLLLFPWGLCLGYPSVLHPGHLLGKCLARLSLLSTTGPGPSQPCSAGTCGVLSIFHLPLRPLLITSKSSAAYKPRRGRLSRSLCLGAAAASSPRHIWSVSRVSLQASLNCSLPPKPLSPSESEWVWDPCPLPSTL